MQFNRECKINAETGKCHTECCVPVGIPLTVWAQYMEAVEVEFDLTIDNGLAVPIAKDARHLCVFKSRRNNACMIYEQRPARCREYGNESAPQMTCAYLDREGVPRTRSVRRRLVRDSTKRYSQGSKRLRVKLKQEGK